MQNTEINRTEENNKTERVFLRGDGFRMTNKSLKYSCINELSDNKMTMWDTDSISSIKEVVDRNFSKTRIVFWVALLIIIIGNNVGGDIINWPEDALIRTYASLGASFVFIFLMIVFHQSIIKPMRYLSIKFKNGAEKKVESPFYSLIDVEKSWDNAVAFGIEANDEVDTGYLKDIYISKESFSISEKTEPLYVIDSLKSMSGLTSWETFDLSRVKKITDDVVSQSWLNWHGAVGGLVGVVLTGLYFTFIHESDIGEAGKWFLVFVLGVIVMMARMVAAQRKRKITIELTGSEVIVVDGNYNWRGKSKAMIGLINVIEDSRQAPFGDVNIAKAKVAAEAALAAEEEAKAKAKEAVDTELAVVAKAKEVEEAKVKADEEAKAEAEEKANADDEANFKAGVEAKSKEEAGGVFDRQVKPSSGGVKPGEEKVKGRDETQTKEENAKNPDANKEAPAKKGRRRDKAKGDKK